MLIGFVLAWISGEGLHPPSLPLFESRRPKGHQQAQRSDMAARVDGVSWGLTAARASGGRACHGTSRAVRSAALRQRYGRSRASADLNGAHARVAFAIRSQGKL